MKNLKLTMSYEDFLSMRDAADHYGITFKEACYQAINDFLQYERHLQATTEKMATKKGQKEVYKKMVTAHKQTKKIAKQSNTTATIVSFPDTQG